MSKHLLSAMSLFICLGLNAQLQISKVMVSNHTGGGAGLFVRFSYPVSKASDITFETGLNVLDFTERQSHQPNYSGPEWLQQVHWNFPDVRCVVPVKAGYRYTFNGQGRGFYVEPQLGLGIDMDYKAPKVIVSGGTGYLFRRNRVTQFDIGIRYETMIYSAETMNYMSLRFSYNFLLHNRK